jgi:hypothetical protein
MCIVIDINTLSSVFDSSSLQHYEFKPVFDWIYNGKGKIVYGGTKYITELSRTKYLNLFIQFRSAGKAIPIDNNLVDRETEKVEALVKHDNFNDQHLVGLLIVSGCLLISSLDKKSYPYITNKGFYQAPLKRPKIYSSRRNANLLTDINIAEICRPCTKTTREQKTCINI